MPRRHSILLISLLTVSLLGCQSQAVVETTDTPAFEWEQSSFSAAGIDSTVVDSIHQEILAGDFGLIDHLMIIKNGKIVFDEHYGQDYDSIGQLHNPVDFQYDYNHPDWHPYYQRTTLHTLQSCTKSVTSLLLGIAVDEGLISDVDFKVMELFASYESSPEEPLKDSISLQDLLTMRGGFLWDEWATEYEDPANSCYVLENEDNWVEHVVNLPMATAPGTEFVYNSGITVLLGEVVRVKTGQYIDEWAEEKLFGPMGITDYYWKKSPNGEVDTEGGLYLSTYDFAKIGQLVLNDGQWQGQQLVSAEWLEESTARLVDLNEFIGYGYQWWIWTPNQDDFQIVMANGFGGQLLFIDEKNDLLTVINGWNINGEPAKNSMSIPVAIAEGLDLRK